MSNIVLLDTGVAGGLLSNDAATTKAWSDFIAEVMASAPGCKFVIPTPVWFEIAQWHPIWHKKIQQQIALKAVSHHDPLYEFAGNFLASPILMDAAFYLTKTCNTANPPDPQGIRAKGSNKISFIDATLAAYSLRFGHQLMTLNQKDFPNKFFDLVEMRSCPKSDALKREFAWLLKPKVTEWAAAKAVPVETTPSTQRNH